MGIKIEREKDELRVLRVTGLLRKSEMDAALAAEMTGLVPAAQVKALIIVTDFKGWERGADWGDMTFFETLGDQVVRIAFVGDPRWETEWLMFVGAGFRRAPVKYFPLDQLDQARGWLEGAGA
ncbi:MAG: STAS/SEC14 domain-containing protein [Thermodesulfobacteriota bacterium]